MIVPTSYGNLFEVNDVLLLPALEAYITEKHVKSDM